jgi:hypothetical protein
MMVRNLLVMVVSAAITGVVVDHTMAQGSGTEYLFSQYYTPPGASIANAEMYPAPHPVPRHVGHTYYTYQPLMPHEMMYQHSRNYYNYYAGPDSFYCNMCGGCSYRPGYGVTKTNVRWQAGCSHIAPLPGTWACFQKVAYCLNRLHTVKPPGGCLGCKGGHCGHCGRLGCKGGCLGHGCHGGKGCLGRGCHGRNSGQCSDGQCWEGDVYQQDTTTPASESTCMQQVDWQQLRQQAAARAAQSMAARYHR